MTILNLTQHKATPDQIHAGVTDLPAVERELLQQLLTFEELPTSLDIEARAEAVAKIARAHEATSAMIGGAPYLMAPLVGALCRAGISAHFAFSARETAEKTNDDGTVTKTAIFRHKGFVEAHPARRPYSVQ